MSSSFCSFWNSWPKESFLSASNCVGPGSLFGGEWPNPGTEEFFWDVFADNLAPSCLDLLFGVTLLACSYNSPKKTKLSHWHNKIRLFFLLLCSISVQMSATWSSSTSLVSRRMLFPEALAGDLVSDSRCHRLRSRLASLTAAFNLSSDRTENWMELPGFSTFSFSFGIGSSRSINTGLVTLGWGCRSLRWTSLCRPAQQLSEFVADFLSTCCITMGPGKRTRVLRFLGFAGISSLNNSCGT